MSWRWSYTILWVAFLLSACGDPPAAPPPPESPFRTNSPAPLATNKAAAPQTADFAGQEDGETRGPNGERCVLFTTDSPFGRDQALRVRSSSCEPPDHPGQMVSHEISRTVIPASQANLGAE